MAALTGDRNTPTRAGAEVVHPVQAARRIFTGALVMLDGGLARPGAVAVGKVAAGRAEHRADNAAGADGAVTVEVRRGTFRWANSAAGDAIGRADIGSACFIVDDQTVAKTNGGATRSAAGTVRDVDALGVWVET